MYSYDNSMSILEQKVNSTDVRLIGVQHTESFFDQYETFYHQEVFNSNALVLEQSLGSDFWDCGFFGKVADIAHSMKKPVYQADSVTSTQFGIDVAQTALGVLLFYAGIFGVAVGGAALVSALVPMVIGTYAWMGTLGGVSTRYMRTDPITDLKEDEFPCFTEDIMFLGMSDYRNIMISRGIERITDKRPSIDRLTGIHGDAHTKPISNYLRSPIIRDAKHKLYLPLEALSSKRKVREYVPSGKGWDLVDEF